LLGLAAREPPTRRERDTTYSVDNVVGGFWSAVALQRPQRHDMEKEEAASQPPGGEAEPRAPVAKAAALRNEQMAEHDKRKAPRLRSVTARFGLALKRPIARMPITGALPSTVIARPPSCGLLPASAPSTRSPPETFRAPKARNPQQNPTAGRAHTCFFATGGKRQPFSSADERVVRPFRDDARKPGMRQKDHKHYGSAIIFNAP
jgi:hypothetical protein